MLLGGWLSLQGLVLLAMYFVGVLVAIPTAWFLKRTVLRGDCSPLVMELPEYKWPDWKVILYRVYEACYAFIVRAGTLIFAASILIWPRPIFPVTIGCNIAWSEVWLIPAMPVAIKSTSGRMT